MTSPEPQPDWSLLPHQPVQFFGLAPGFDRRALKRAYHQLLHRFKPEKHPAEFQRIRKAYEDLDRRLSQAAAGLEPVVRPFSVIDPQSPAPTENAVQSPAKGPPTDAVDTGHGNSTPANAAATAAPVVPLLERIETLTLEELLEDFENHPPRTPREELARLLLRDMRQRGDESAFLEQLLAARVRFPHDATLERLLADFLVSPEAARQSGPLLRILFARWPFPSVWSLSKPLFRALSSQVEPVEFQKTLRECERLSSAHRWAERFDFDLFLCRLRVLSDDPQTTNVRLAQLDRIQNLDSEEETQLSLLLVLLRKLLDYRQQRAAFLNGDPVRQRCDEVLRAWCENAPDFAERFHTCCDALVGDFAALQRGFDSHPGATPQEPSDDESASFFELAEESEAAAASLGAFLRVWKLMASLARANNPASRVSRVDEREAVTDGFEMAEDIWNDRDYRVFRTKGPDITILRFVLGGFRGLWSKIGPWSKRSGHPQSDSPAPDLRTVYLRSLRPRLLQFVRETPISLSDVAEFFRPLRIPAHQLEPLLRLIRSDTSLEMLSYCRYGLF